MLNFSIPVALKNILRYFVTTYINRMVMAGGGIGNLARWDPSAIREIQTREKKRRIVFLFFVFAYPFSFCRRF